MKEYETIVVLRPDAAEEPAKQLLGKLKTTIANHGGEILQQKDWGKRSLAYCVANKYNQGVYLYYDYAGDSGLVADFEKVLRLSDIPLKFLTVKLADVVDVKVRKKALAESDKEAQTKKAEIKEVKIEEVKIEAKVVEEVQSA